MQIQYNFYNKLMLILFTISLCRREMVIWVTVKYKITLVAVPQEHVNLETQEKLRYIILTKVFFVQLHIPYTEGWKVQCKTASCDGFSVISGESKVRFSLYMKRKKTYPWLSWCSGVIFQDQSQKQILR